MLPMKCDNSSNGNGMVSLSASVAVDVAGVAPETSSQPPATSVKAASNQGEIAAAARPSGAPTPNLSSYSTSNAVARVSGSQVIDAPIQHQCAKDFAGRRSPAAGEQNHGFKDAQAAWHMTDQSRGDAD